jgi:hypothetical protein
MGQFSMGLHVVCNPREFKSIASRKLGKIFYHGAHGTHVEAPTMVLLTLTPLASTTKWMQGWSPFTHSSLTLQPWLTFL